MKIKVNEASGPVLDWMVAKCWYSDRRIELTEGKTGVRVLRNPEYDGSEHSHWFVFFGSTYWEQGGPIIEREGITLRNFIQGDAWDAQLDYDETFLESGPTPLIAAMRCYVASKLGEEVEVPDGLA